MIIRVVTCNAAATTRQSPDITIIIHVYTEAHDSPNELR